MKKNKIIVDNVRYIVNFIYKEIVNKINNNKFACESLALPTVARRNYEH